MASSSATWRTKVGLAPLRPSFQALGTKNKVVLQEHSIKQDESWADMYMASKPGFTGGHIPVLTLVDFSGSRDSQFADLGTCQR